MKKEGRNIFYSMYYVFRCHVPDFPDYTGIFYPYFYQRPGSAAALHLGNQCIYPDDNPFKLSVCIRGRFYCSWAQQNRPGAFALAKGRLYALYYDTACFLWRQKRFLRTASGSGIGAVMSTIAFLLIFLKNIWKSGKRNHSMLVLCCPVCFCHNLLLKRIYYFAVFPLKKFE